eukprot:COSAG05_NODE_21250_length_273_cov_0.597701_1_plen_56_part_01
MAAGQVLLTQERGIVFRNSPAIDETLQCIFFSVAAEAEHVELKGSTPLTPKIKLML